MTGIAEHNFPAFRKAAENLRRRGFDVVSPAELDEANGYIPPSNGAAVSAGDYADLLARDVVLMSGGIDGVVVLDGWEQSGGAKAEVAFARALGLPVFAYPFLKEIPEDVRRQDDSIIPSSDEVRIVDPVTGGAKGQKLARFDLIPPDALRALAEHFGRGARKYEDRNWEKGYLWSLTFQALNRHLWAFWQGEDMDPDSDDPQPHLAAVAWHAMVLLTFYLRGAGTDDRPKLPSP